MTETAIRADCDATGRAGVWRVAASEKQVPMSPMSCLEISSSNKVVLFNHTLPLRTNGMAMETLEEWTNLNPGGGCQD
jgi:hypothetical protein